MLAAIVEQAFGLIQPFQTWLSYQIRVEALLALVCLFAYGSWWVIRFTVVPSLYPHDPVELSYPIPVLGHSKAFFENSHRLVSQGIEHCCQEKEPFALTVAGKLYYVVPSPEDASALIRNVTSLSWDEFLTNTLIGFGIHRDRLALLSNVSGKTSKLNPKRKPLMNLTEDLCKQQLLPGPKFDDALSNFEHIIQETLGPRAMKRRFRIEAPISLLSLCTTLIDATQQTLFDDALQQIDSDMVEGMVVLSDEAWKLMNPTPFVNSEEVDSLKTRYIRSLSQYVCLPKSARSRESWLVSAVIEAYQAAGTNEHDIAVVLLMVYWAAVTNTYKLAFWTLSHILFDKDLYETIKQETECCVKDSMIDMRHLTDDCPLLNSVYHESMRLTKRDISIRKVTKDTVIGGKILREGNLAFVPYCQLHTVGKVWGENPKSFSSRRFLDSGDLLNSKSYRPFGGGLTYCPGRFLVGPQIFSLIALLIHRWDIQLCENDRTNTEVTTPSPFPLIDDSTITFGISRPTPASQVLVRLQRKYPF